MEGCLENGMQQMYDDAKEDREYLARREQRRQRRLEAQRRRQKQLRLIKLSCVLGLAGVLILSVIIGNNQRIEKKTSKEQP